MHFDFGKMLENQCLIEQVCDEVPENSPTRYGPDNLPNKHKNQK